ncbi:Protein O-mannosyltransferase 2 [Coemansia spiralis]|uniref:Dolichyl-phosphate-mannose--protein mannosyltransferase n=2 Tax=Coemansia TaxID=4863 RepID=A0A9W8L101_9FUNG|nr:glycosyltransferase family 39 protein [Coemansia spiralis]KAJ1995670.1 Protein O-mannosyltransferase 2 [Coemansia umbellata]KAJ2623724.1 Protein O-mannosyltransferase 2 [Coemansia sp. RSA 1358]KAJ2680357.1 Protein O-mannosyltransferase 2 [Coemansia spiralis]
MSTKKQQQQQQQQRQREQKDYGSFVAYPVARAPVATSVPYKRNEWLTSIDGPIVILLTLLCAFTRLYEIGKRAVVTWDESHFGKFGAYYINRTFYHDVHPPLAKMLIGFSEFLAGHNGTFTFKGEYPPYVNFRFMRCFTAIFGIGLAPLAYITCLQLNMQRKVCVLAALFVIFDNGLCVMSRFVLLDEPLLLFTAASLCSIAGFQNTRHRMFTCAWWRWLLLTGCSLGLVSSSKWVGFLAVALVGLYTIEELFNMYVDAMPLKTVARHFAARALGLIVVPFIIYVACFKIHFLILNRSGPGDATMPPTFQARLKGSPLGHQPFAVVYGSQLNLRSMCPGSGLLHSHPHAYPVGSQQQQITCYSHKDSNNDWIIVKPAGEEFNYTSEPLITVRDGDIVSLMHRSTKRMLHAHSAHLAPITTSDYEVTGYGKPEWKDKNNSWRIEIARETSSTSNGELHTITTMFRLRHVVTNCLLSAAAVKLPSWGFRQTEVSCSRENKLSSTTSLWVIERHINSRVPAEDLRHMIKGSFFSDFLRLNMEMARSNNALVPDRDKYNHLESSPWSWPLLIYPMRMLGSWKRGDIKYYEVGNPLLWWMSSLVCLLFPLQLFYYYVRKRRGLSSNWAPGEELHFWNGAKLLWGGWVLHYFPFYLMGRVTYIHHYLPALYFALLFLAFEIDHCCRRLFSRGTQDIVVLVWAIGAVAVFCWFAPLTFGYSGDIRELKNRQWLSTWNLYSDPYVM